MGIKDALSRVIGIEDDEEDELEPTQEEIEEEAEKLSRSMNNKSSSSGSKPDNYYGIIPPVAQKGGAGSYSMNGSAPFKMVVIEPRTFDECTKLVDNLKSRKPVIINLEKVETDLARKMFDFMNGATYALNGNVQKVTSNIFIFAPANVDIAAKVNKETVAENVFGTEKSPWN